MKKVSREEQIITDVEYFILVENQKLKKHNNFTFDFKVLTQCEEIDNCYCVYFENFNEAVNIISKFSGSDYKTPVKIHDIKIKLSGLMYHQNLNSEKPFWISFYVQ